MQQDYNSLLKRVEQLEKENKKLMNLYDEYYYIRYPGKTIYQNANSFDSTSLIGFYGKDPIKQQTATDLATTIAALKAYGLLAP